MLPRVGLVGQLLRLVVGQVGDDDLKGDCQAEPLTGLADAHLGTHRRIAEILVRVAGHHLQGGVEAGGVTGGEQLFGVGALTAAAHLPRDGQVEREPAVGGLDVAVAACAGGDGLGGVDGLDLDHGASWAASVRGLSCLAIAETT